MRTIIVLPIPFDKFDIFERFVRRFIDSFKQFPPGTEDYEIQAVCNWGEPTDEIREWFWGTKTRFVPYYEDGCDIGSAQVVANKCGCGDFILAMTSRCYFHRQGWLLPYLRARTTHGTGLYGASCSHEGGTLHCCTRAYAMDHSLWQKYPYEINTRARGQKFEVGEWCVTNWVKEQGFPVMQVTWDGERPIEDGRNPAERHIYRRGEQKAMLVWDRHTQIWDEANDEEKARLTKMADGVA